MTWPRARTNEPLALHGIYSVPMAVKHQGRQPQPPVSGVKNILIEQLDQRLGLDNRLAAGAHSSRGSSCPRRPGGRRLSRTTPLPNLRVGQR